MRKVYALAIFGLLGVNHAFNGYMEYWATLPKGGLGGHQITAICLFDANCQAGVV